MYPRNSRFQGSSLPCGRWPTTQRTAPEGSTPFYLEHSKQSPALPKETRTGIDDILLGVGFVLLDVSGERDRVVHAVLPDLLVDLGRERSNLLEHYDNFCAGKRWERR